MNEDANASWTAATLEKSNTVNTDLLKLLLSKGYVPIVTPIAMSEEFEPLNVDGDRTAAIIAGALKADKLILLTDVAGLNAERRTHPQNRRRRSQRSPRQHRRRA